MFAIIYPRTADENGIAKLPKADLKSGQLSVCRGEYSTYAELLEKVVRPQLERDPTRRYAGYHWVPCQEVRSIEAKISPGKAKKQGDENENVGAFCVVDDAVDGYTAHARLGFSKPPEAKFWEKHDREAARGNLLVALQVRGAFNPSENETETWPGFARPTKPTAEGKWKPCCLGSAIMKVRALRLMRRKGPG